MFPCREESLPRIRQPRDDMLNFIAGNFVQSRLYPARLLMMILLLSGVIPAICAAAGQNSTVAGIHPALKKGVLLVASRQLIDPYFQQSVVLLTQYGQHGSSGIILNWQTDLPVADTFPEIVKILPVQENLYIGGPVATSRISLLLHSQQNIPGANEVIADVYHIDSQVLFYSLDFDELQPSASRLFSGFAGWSPGQLEAEVKRGDWYTWRADAGTIFSRSPLELWQELIDLASSRWVLR